MNQQVKTKDVTAFLRDMINLTLAYEVDEEGYVVSKRTGERTLIGEGDQKRPIILYQEEIRDQTAHILNPLAEGLGETPSAFWFYRVHRIDLFGRFVAICRLILTTALTEKTKAKTAKESDTHLPMEVLNIASLIIDDVDEKLIDELTQIASDRDTGEFLTVYYQRNHMRSILRSPLLDGDDGSPASFRSKFPKVRKKTWTVLHRLVSAILGIQHADEISKFTRKATELSCVRLSSFLNVILAVYQDINPLLATTEPSLAIDLTNFVHHLNLLPAYATNARFMAQATRSTPAPTPMMIPGAAPQQQQHVLAVVPGPMVDGRPTVVQQTIPYGYVGNQGDIVPGPSHSVVHAVPQGGPGGPYGGYAPPMQQQQPYGGAGFMQPPFDGPYQQRPWLGQSTNMQGGFGSTPGMPVGFPRL